MIRTFCFILFILMVSCVSGPEIVPGKGAVYGVVTAKSHRDLVAKALKEKDTEYAENGRIRYTKHMVDYRNLDEIYVGLIDPDHRGGQSHAVTARNEGFSLRSLAVAVGDKMVLTNNTSVNQHFYIVDSFNGIIKVPRLAPGETTEVEIYLSGDLELGSDNSEQLFATILSLPGLRTNRLTSGDRYAFERLKPGKYRILFWFWRLGMIDKEIIIQPGVNIRLDEVLSVDKMIERHNESSP